MPGSFHRLPSRELELRAREPYEALPLWEGEPGLNRNPCPAEVRFCVDVLGARRIAHGVLAADDSTLIAHLAKLNVCSEPGNYNTFMESHYHESRLHVYDFNAWVLGQRS